MRSQAPFPPHALPAWGRAWHDRLPRFLPDIETLLFSNEKITGAQRRRFVQRLPRHCGDAAQGLEDRTGGAGTRRWAGRVALSPAGALEQPTPLGIGVLSCALDFWWLGRFSAGSHWRGWPCPLEHTSSPPCRCFSGVRRGRRTGLHLRVLLEIWTPALGVPWILAWLPSSGQHPCFTSLSQNRAHCKKCNLSPFALLNALY